MLWRRSFYVEWRHRQGGVKMKNAAWFKCFPRDFLEGFEGLNADEIALYTVACLRMYAVGGPIDYSPQTLGGIAKIGTRKAGSIILKLIGLDKLILTNDGRLYNRKAAEVQNQKLSVSAVRSEAGSKGGRPRKDAASGSGSTPVSGSVSPPLQGRSQTTYQPSSENQMLPLETPKPAENGESGSDEPAQTEKQTHKQNGPYAGARPRASESETEEEDNHPRALPSPRAQPGDWRQEEDLIGGEDRIATPEEHAAAFAECRSLVRFESNDPDRQEVDVVRLTGRIMKAANMVAPPIDLALVGGWAKIMTEERIMELVHRMVGSSRGPVRQMRYFDGEIRRIIQVEAEAAKVEREEHARRKERWVEEDRLYREQTLREREEDRQNKALIAERKAARLAEKQDRAQA